MVDPTAAPPDDEPKSPMWLPALGAALFLGVGIWWAVTPSSQPPPAAEPPAEATAAAVPPAAARSAAGPPAPAKPSASQALLPHALPGAGPDPQRMLRAPAGGAP